MSLIDYCSNDQQREIVRLHEQGFSSYDIAEYVSSKPTNIRRSIRRAKANAAKHADSPEKGLNRPVPDGYTLKGFSDMRTNEEGKPIWYKVDQDKEQQIQLMNEAIQELKKDISPIVLPEPANLHRKESLTNLHVLTDFHMGMLAWGEETGDENWDLKKSEDFLTKWFQHAVAKAPEAKTGILCELGDFLHYDSLESVTPASKNILDTDSRHQLMVRTAIRSMRTLLDLMLQKYEQVHVVIAEGNHNETGSNWMREMFAEFLQSDRVTVDTNPDPYYCYEFGNVSLFFHHGHKTKFKQAQEAFVGKFRDLFGRTKFSYAHTGHLHHYEKETGLMTVVQHRTMSAKDAYASRHAYASDRSADVTTYSNKYGYVGTQETTPEMVWDELLAEQ